MRLEQLEIGGFGALNDVDIDFHPRLTVIVGENESGKSTVHRALRAALYGIDAGGPGRAADRSEWSRWSPWAGGRYSIALTYALADGARLRVARRLDTREQVCQVQEIGGAEVTDRFRRGRLVVPGEVHLGIDEAVFCASACVGDDGLRLGAADTPAIRAAGVQEAIERLADSGNSTTATEALVAIREAARRVGSERRVTSPLGQAIARVRQLDLQLEDARRRFGALAAEEERLRRLEADAAAAEVRRLDAERRWLLGRLAAIARQGLETQAITAELTHLAAEIEGNAHRAAFPLESEDRAVTLAAEVGEARRSADEAGARATAAAAPLADVRRRLAEIGAGLRALGDPSPLPEHAQGELDDIREHVVTAAARAGSGGLAASVARRDALRHEVALTGLAAVPPTAVDSTLDLVAALRGQRGRWGRRLGTVLLVGGLAAAALGVAAHRSTAGIAAGVTALVGLAVLLGVDRLAGGDAASALARLSRLAPGLALDDEGIARLEAGLPRLAALYAELQREEIRVETAADEVSRAHENLETVARRAEMLAAAHGLRPMESPGRAPETAEARARAVLDGFQRAAMVTRRRQELAAEQELLTQRLAELEGITEDAARRRQTADEAGARLVRLLEAAEVNAAGEPAVAVARFREACAQRRRHDAAVRRHTELSRLQLSSGDARSLERLARQLEIQLSARGGNPADVNESRPLSPSELQELENEASHARQSAVAAVSAADQLRARLGEMRGNVPPVADLEDERASCVAARERAFHQLRALNSAAELIEQATRGVHQDLAPLLAASVAHRLALLTDGRYSAVNVDTAHFAVTLLGSDRPDLVPLELLSHGTRDQVSLLLRLALAEVLSGSGEPVPLLLDEPLISADPQRRETALRFLWSLSATNQVVISTSDPGMVSMLSACCDGDEAGVVTLPGPGAAIETVGRPVRRVRVL